MILPPKITRKCVFTVGFHSFTKYLKSVVDIKKKRFGTSNSQLFELQNDIKISMKNIHHITKVDVD